LEEIFTLFDENGDGFISAKELKAVLEKFGEKITLAEAKKMIAEADLNNDGMIDKKGLFFFKKKLFCSIFLFENFRICKNDGIGCSFITKINKKETKQLTHFSNFAVVCK
jgi:hypothetical protein